MKPLLNASRSRRSGFSLIELVVVILIMTVLAGVVVPRVLEHQKSARDARRLADAKALQKIIEQYYMEKGVFPGTRSWNRSTDATGFINELVEEGYLAEPVQDPINDRTYHYRYRTFRAGAHGCVGQTDFYVLGIRNFESSDFAAENPGYFRCANKDFSDTFDFVTGGGASFR